jgi:hypothetical protein
MNARLLTIALLGVAVGATAVSLNPLHSAPAPDPRPAHWEYKVVYLTTIRGDDKPADVLSDQLNTLAKDGWEFVGPVFGDSSGGRGGGGGSGRPYVAFRRFKP